MARFTFRFHPLYRVLAAPFGITPETAMVELVDDDLKVRFGPWVVETTRSNVTSVEITGPYSIPKTAGPARLSLADRGLTMATNPDQGLCLSFETPVTGLDPLGGIRHPGLTLTVDRIDDLRRALTEDLGDEELDEMSAGVTGESPWAVLRRVVSWPAGMAATTVGHLRMLLSIDRSYERREGRGPELQPPDDTEDLQPIESGVGPVYERTYTVVIEGCDLTPEEVLERVASDLNSVSPVQVAEFVDQTSQTEGSSLGDEYLIRMPGPWRASVRCIERTPTSFRLATLEGHMEAGQVELSADWAGEPPHAGESAPISFQVRSVARSSGRSFALLYDRLRFAAEMQMHMWVHLCQRVAVVTGGSPAGSVEVKTIRYAR